MRTSLWIPQTHTNQDTSVIPEVRGTDRRATLTVNKKRLHHSVSSDFYMCLLAHTETHSHEYTHMKQDAVSLCCQMNTAVGRKRKGVAPFLREDTKLQCWNVIAPVKCGHGQEDQDSPRKGLGESIKGEKKRKDGPMLHLMLAELLAMCSGPERQPEIYERWAKHYNKAVGRCRKVKGWFEKNLQNCEHVLLQMAWVLCVLLTWIWFLHVIRNIPGRKVVGAKGSHGPYREREMWLSIFLESSPLTVTDEGLVCRNLVTPSRPQQGKYHWKENLGPGDSSSESQW